MFLMEGAVAILLSAVVYGWAYRYNRSPAAPGWARGQLFASVVSLVLVCSVPLGAGLIALGLSAPLTAMGWAGLALMLAAPLVLWGVLRSAR